MNPTSLGAKRLWRLRKLRDTVDAIATSTAEGSIDVEFRYNGRVVYRLHGVSAESATEEATRRRAELEREGWSFHW